MKKKFALIFFSWRDSHTKFPIIFSYFFFWGYLLYAYVIWYKHTHCESFQWRWWSQQSRSGQHYLPTDRYDHWCMVRSNHANWFVSTVCCPQNHLYFSRIVTKVVSGKCGVRWEGSAVMAPFIGDDDFDFEWGCWWRSKDGECWLLLCSLKFYLCLG